MIEQEFIDIPDMILLLLNFFCFKKIKIKAEIVLSPGGAYFVQLKKAYRPRRIKGDVKLVLCLIVRYITSSC